MDSKLLAYNSIEESEFEIGEEISFDDVNDYELEARISKERFGGGGIVAYC